MVEERKLNEDFCRKRFESFQEFRDKVGAICADGKNWIFRGQGLWTIPSPSYFRERSRVPKATTRQTELENIAGFRATLGNAFPKDTTYDWWILTWLQHYGAPTRLLDWTSDPLVALWFAAWNRLRDIERGLNGQANAMTVWLLQATVEEEFFSKQQPSEFQNVIITRPPQIDVRVLAQRSLFSVHPIPKSGVDLIKGGWANVVEMLHKQELISLFADDSALPEIFRCLDEEGITASSMFPDLRGAAQNATDRYEASPAMQRIQVSYRFPWVNK